MHTDSLSPSLTFLRDVRLMVFPNSLLEVNLPTHLWSLTGTRTVILWPVLRILHLITVWKLLTDLLSGETIKTAGNEWGLDQQSCGNMRRSNCESNPGSKLMLAYYQSAMLIIDEFPGAQQWLFLYKHDYILRHNRVHTFWNVFFDSSSHVQSGNSP